MNNFLENVIPKYPFFISQSPKIPVETETIHIARYGIDEYNALDLIEKCKTSLMYFGRSVTIMKNPQSCPIWAQTRAIIGALVKIILHGVAGRFGSRSNCPNSFCKYSFSLSFMYGCEFGLL